MTTASGVLQKESIRMLLILHSAVCKVMWMDLVVMHQVLPTMRQEPTAHHRGTPITASRHQVQKKGLITIMMIMILTIAEVLITVTLQKDQQVKELQPIKHWAY